jgi:folate-binding protein YgfZ
VEGLERYLIADDVELVRRAEYGPLVGLEGPSAPAAVRKLFGNEAVRGEPYHHQTVNYEGADLGVFEVSEVGASGFLVSGPKVNAVSLFEALCDVGATPIGMDALNVLRVERGVPWIGLDMDENVLLMEVGLDDAVSFKKGCYLGQEVVERVSARGHVNRKLTGLLLEGTEVVPAGSTILHDGAEVGWTASSVESFALQRPIALAYLRREFLEPGRQVRVLSNGRRRDATVHVLPFVASVA